MVSYVRLFCYYVLLISPSFGALKGLCFVIVGFQGGGVVHFYVW